MTEAGGQDSWIGNALIVPTSGKQAVQPPADPKGRRDLFDVLGARAPGVPADDSWLGHAAIDPARGRAHPPGPEQLRGRRDLTEIFTMSILHDPRRLELLQKGADKLGDAWCGHKLIDPAKGKSAAAAVHSPAAVAHLHGATFPPGQPVAAPHSDLPTRHMRQAPPPAPDTASAVVSQTAGPGDDWGKGGRKTFPDLPAPNAFDGRKDLYGHMTFRPLGEVEAAKYGRAFDDRGTTGRRTLAQPGSVDPAKGPDLLQWKPEVGAERQPAIPSTSLAP
ncbi:hypothetical protein HYH03_018359 [Edaphochlamys debaryana]|uniref:Uncharacterized protein n=1 Tax=Edaphochlamys debaryana TaxID=47281 RepID=A0A836BPL7_9CHLO|nr:hypothetical protein HYH03_018359 [Edaphochlamys debaryana]|eukprot:KAG2482728.1 hypothetical protein HYH03_018359 [Edaphochlamys debaryana]